jgi:hypothetical protein
MQEINEPRILCLIDLSLVGFGDYKIARQIAIKIRILGVPPDLAGLLVIQLGLVPNRVMIAVNGLRKF